MYDIIFLFSKIGNNVAILSMFLPLIADFFARRKKIEYSNDLKIFALFYYYSCIIQLIASILAKVFHSHNLFIFHFYLPIQIVAISYLLLKWLGLKKNVVLLLAAFFGLITFSGDLYFSSLNEYPYFMLWFNISVLLVLSFILSYSNDKRKIHLPCEFNYIHIGIYVYSIITLIGLSPAHTDFRVYGYFFHAMASTISYYFFMRSFRCLYHKNG